jgi:hypothetical protein
LTPTRTSLKVLCVKKNTRQWSDAMSKLLPAVAFGLVIAYVDSRPNWDDTGITAGAIFAACGLLGILGPERPWLWALGVGAWVPVYGIVSAGNYFSLLALVIAFAGAYAGMACRKTLELRGS